MTRLKSSAHLAAVLARAVSPVLAGSAVLVLASCSGGPVAQNTPQGGANFVGSSYNSTFYRPGSRPVAPAVSGTTLTGQRFSLGALKGSVVVLNFWGSWCPPCRREAPALAALARHFPAGSVHFVGIDERDSVPSAEAFEHTFGVGYPSVNDPGGAIALAFHGTVPPMSFPTTLVIDKTGHIAASVFGEVSFDGLRALITKILAGTT
ncbi:MAG TPA: TlpA disulfide reductase family protein [Streptosporangiaceae bacterium]